MEIIEVKTPAELDQIKDLIREYYEFLRTDHDLDISYQGIEAELASLPGKYAPPEGRLLLAFLSGRAVGCALLRPLDPGVCELKRMYVLPEARGQGAGRALALYLIQEAKAIGYQRMRLDTGTFLSAALKLYESLGFQPIAPYNEVPENLRQVAVFMEISLA